MKNLMLLGFLVLFLVLVQYTQAQTVDDVINKNIEARGGKAKINSIQNVVMQGSLNYQGADIAIEITQVNNKLFRQDISVNGMTGFTMSTDKEGWTYMPFFGMQKPEPVSAEELLLNKSDIDLAGPLVDYASKGHKVELAGKEMIDGKNAHKLKVTLNGGKVVTIFIDEQTNLITRTVDKRKVNGQETDVQTDLGDYKEVEGVKMAHSLTQQYGTTYMSSIKVNQAIPESAYKHDM